MPYPLSPFPDKFNTNILNNLRGDNNGHVIQNQHNAADLENTLKWLCTNPKITSYRINTLKSDKYAVLKCIQKQIHMILGENTISPEYHAVIPNVITLKHINTNKKLTNHLKEVIIDAECASAILRGAHIFAPGIIGMIFGTKINDVVSIYVDINKKCKKGFAKIFVDDKKIFIGNGIIKMTREQLFSANLQTTGVAVEVLETISGCPCLGDNFLPTGYALLQNLPSTICVNELNPKPNEVILDMCASPGNKTTHIAELMKNQGLLIAIDKTPKKVEQLNRRCDDFKATVVLTYQADSTKIFDKTKHVSTNERSILQPLFPAEYFDRILLDVPCSALGKRPQLINNTNEKVVQSYVPLQRKLLTTAINILKINGTLVYSTCTITLAENEGNVAWVLENFPCLELVATDFHLGGPGWKGTNMSEENRCKVQRFGPDQEDVIDSVGFFIAKFVKRTSHCDEK